MKKTVFLGLALILLISCTSSPPQTVERVLIQCSDGSLADSIDNCPSLTDRADTPQIIENLPIEPVNESVLISEQFLVEANLMKQLVESAPKTYWFVNEAEGIGVVVKGTKRSTGVYYDPYWQLFYSLMYWDPTVKNLDGKIPVYISFGEVPEVWWLNRTGQIKKYDVGMSKTYLPAFLNVNLTGDKIKDNLIIPKDFNKMFYDAKESSLSDIFDPLYEKGPVDYLVEYVNEIPLEITNSSRTVKTSLGSFTSNLQIKFKNKENPSQTVVFVIDKNVGVPRLLEFFDESGRSVKRIVLDFDTVYGKHGKKNIKLEDANLELPKNHIIFTTEDALDWWEHREG